MNRLMVEWSEMEGSDVEDSLSDGSGCIETRKDTNGDEKHHLVV